VNTREGDAQKALRRTYVTSSLVCVVGNPREVASELGHATSRMVSDVYDSCLDPKMWPDAQEIARIVAIYGWQSVPDAVVTAHPDSTPSAPMGSQP
jgi:hypothetical protein